MHGIPAKSLNIDSMVVKQVAIESIIVPDFFVVLVLQIIFEMIDKSCVLAKIVDKNPGAVSKIVLRACKE
jgi:hypothetical protein